MTLKNNEILIKLNKTSKIYLKLLQDVLNCLKPIKLLLIKKNAI